MFVKTLILKVNAFPYKIYTGHHYDVTKNRLYM